jgi:hypothetical protein
MNELTWVYGTASLMVATFVVRLVTKKFDPFEPIWLFFVGYMQVYVVQAISYHDWAMELRGEDLVNAANFRAFWALAVFLGIYSFGPGKLFSKFVPKPPTTWSLTPVNLICPILLVWGVYCSGILIHTGAADPNSGASPEQTLLASFHMVLLVAGVILIVTGRQLDNPKPAYTATGIAVVVAYLVIWMYNGKRSHSLVAVLTGVCAFYIPRLKRPSFPVLFLTAVVGMFAVGISIGWRYYCHQSGATGSFSTFVDFVSTFNVETILESINLKERENANGVKPSFETEEYGGFLLMMDTVPLKSEYDYGMNYLRIFSTYIPRVVWPDKPLYGRDQWVAAWIAGSELKRDATFTGPSIGILGATHLNGGDVGTFLVLGAIGLLLRTGYEYFHRHASCAWVQVWWSLIFFNSWMMTVGDDPFTWFYYNYGFTILPSMALLFCLNKLARKD